MLRRSNGSVLAWRSVRDMAEKVLRPDGKGFILLDSHPVGCARTVEEMIAEVGAPVRPAPGPRALVIGCTAGYGLAAALTGLFGYNACIIGLGYERAATARRSASAGWYRAAALASRAGRAGLRFSAVNGDCFDPEVRAGVLDRAAADLGQLDILIYSVAAPRRTDPQTGQVHHSAVKPVGATYRARNLAYPDGERPAVRAAALEPATDAEIEATVKVMGGEDWAAWIADLAARGMLVPGFRTAALTYVGSDLTAPIYRQGTIGRAKDHLEATAAELTENVLAPVGGQALTSVNGAAVTLSSLAIPGISVYLSLLHEVAGRAGQSPVRQSARLWDHLTGREAGAVDELGRLRLDDWELADDVQAELRARWHAPQDELVAGLADPGWFRIQLLRLYGFGVTGIDYGQPAEVDVPWPS
jgi:enoyl-[acyl-carrier protein] reductase / trans-2-enoyl-CoA reductase (NAD+)